MTQAATMTEQVVEQFQRDRSEWFSAPVREILGEYETWRSGQGSAALPSEAITPEMEVIGRKTFDETPGTNWERAMAAYEAMRAATPTAPVQDDDVELVRQLRSWRFDSAGNLGKIARGAADAIERLSRLSPTPDTGLIEAATEAAERLHLLALAEGHGTLMWRVNMRIFENVRTALANAAPAQVESGK